MWRGSDLNSKKPSKAEWTMVCLPKNQGGLEVINLTTHNDALLLNFMHKFFTKANIPWVRLVWDNYYPNGKLPVQQKKGSFWWKDIVKLLETYKRFASVMVTDGSSVLFWNDTWNGHNPRENFPEFASFAIDKSITVKEVFTLQCW